MENHIEKKEIIEQLVSQMGLELTSLTSNYWIYESAHARAVLFLDKSDLKKRVFINGHVYSFSELMQCFDLTLPDSQFDEIAEFTGFVSINFVASICYKLRNSEIMQQAYGLGKKIFLHTDSSLFAIPLFEADVFRNIVLFNVEDQSKVIRLETLSKEGICKFLIGEKPERLILCDEPMVVLSLHKEPSVDNTSVFFLNPSMEGTNICIKLKELETNGFSNFEFAYSDSLDGYFSYLSFLIKIASASADGDGYYALHHDGFNIFFDLFYNAKKLSIKSVDFMNTVKKNLEISGVDVLMTTFGKDSNRKTITLSFLRSKDSINLLCNQLKPLSGFNHLPLILTN